MKIHKHLSLVVIPAHIFLIALIWYVQLPLFVIPAIFLTWVIIGGFGLDIGIHRIISHRQFSVNIITERILSYLGLLGLNGSPIFWRALHVGYHHPRSDTPRDFHSPVNGGFLNAYVLYINKLDTLKFLGCKELLNDKFQMFLQNHDASIVWVTLLLVLLVSPLACTILLAAMVMSFHQTAIVNALCHFEQFGYATYDTKDRSRNIKWLSYLTFGLALHNNHHKYPAAPNYAMNPGEYDIGYNLAKLARFRETE